MTTRVIVTGAASGIGAATSAELRQRGCEVVGLDRQAGDGIIECDVRDQASVDTAVASAVGQLGGLDAVVNCAGIAPPQSAGLPPDARAEATIDINLLGPWRVTAAALPALRAARGRVVNVASGMAFVAVPFAPAYAMSKHGVPAYSQALRLEHGDAITVTTVYPGVVRTGIQKDSEEFGLGLGGVSAEEPMSAAVHALCRAVLSPKPPRDITTTRGGWLNNALCRYAPPALVDSIVLSRMAKAVPRLKFVDPNHPVALFAARRGRWRPGTQPPAPDPSNTGVAPAPGSIVRMPKQ